MCTTLHFWYTCTLTPKIQCVTTYSFRPPTSAVALPYLDVPCLACLAVRPLDEATCTPRFVPYFFPPTPTTFRRSRLGKPLLNLSLSRVFRTLRVLFPEQPYVLIEASLPRARDVELSLPAVVHVAPVTIAVTASHQQLPSPPLTASRDVSHGFSVVGGLPAVPLSTLRHERPSSKRSAPGQPTSNGRPAFASQEARCLCQPSGRAQKTCSSTSPTTIQADQQFQQVQDERPQQEHCPTSTQLLRHHRPQGRPENTGGVEAPTTTEWRLVGPPTSG